MDVQKIKTIGELKKAGYNSKSIKEELRANLVKRIAAGEQSFQGILGFDETVIPDLERAILSRHNILLLGLRGQAKTRIARMLTELLDEYVPIIKDSEINDDPLNPISLFGRSQVEEFRDKTEISWLHRSDRYIEKLATPDVSVADLIGDVDPIKAATLKLPYSDERVIHFGLIPRSHRCIFVINELPDLQARIQVSLFNILQEEDLQIRGFTFRFPLDIQFLFTANPEDYTNRGSIVTPLKDRIESQILTHYPKTISIAKDITKQEAKIHPDQVKVQVSDLVRDILERIVMEARDSEYVDVNSGVSARLSITAMENLVSAAERRMIINGEKESMIRLADFWGIIPSITGKIELVYEGEQEGPYMVALHLINQAMKESFNHFFPSPNAEMKKQDDIYKDIKAWFQTGNTVDLINDESDKSYLKKLDTVTGLSALLKKCKIVSDKKDPSLRELVLHGLAAHEVIGKDFLENRLHFSDPLAGMLSDFE